MHGSWVIAVALAAALISPSAAAAQDPPQESGSAVVFSERGEVPRALYRVDAGGDRARLSGEVDAIQPSWSPDGRMLAFAGNFGTAGEEGVFVVRADGTGSPNRLTTGRALYPAWSHDGRWIAYSGPGGHLHVVAASGGTPRALTHATPSGFVGDVHPTWSPDGSRVAFARLRDPGGEEIRWVSATGGSEGSIAAGGTMPTWSPTGDLIAFFGAGLEVVHPDGGGRRTVVEHGRFGAAWSPDGGRLAVPFADDLIVADVADGSSRALVRNVGHEILEPTWSGDGHFVSFSAGDVHRVAVEDGSVQQMSSSGTAREPAAWPGRTLRIAGASRVETSVAVSQQIGDRAGTVVLASAGDYPDGLAGSALAAALEAPLLLTGRDALHDAVADEIRRLGARRAVLLGGEGALGSQVSRDLSDMGLSVERVAGSNRFATAADIARRLDASHAYLVQGASTDPARGWPDAVSVSGLAATQGRPILLALRNSLPEETANAIHDTGITHITVIGGEAAIDSSVVRSLEERGVDVDRIAGATRYATSLAVTQRAVEVGDASASTVWLATGRNWPDSLAAGSAVAATGGILLLVDGQNPAATPATYEWLSGRVGTARAVGGADVLGPTTALRTNQLPGDPRS